MIVRVLRLAGKLLFFAVIGLCLALNIVPHFLDAIYYRGPVSAHFDGARFRNPDRDDELRAAPQASRSSVIWRTLTGGGGAMSPAWPDHVTVTPHALPARVAGQEMIVTWVGHATVLVQTQGLNILTDPIWSHRAGPLGFGPGRVAAPGIAFDKLPKIDLILVSHNHFDHMDLATLKKLSDRDRPLIVSSLGNDGVIEQAGVPARTLDWGGRLTVRPGVEVIVTRNHHWSTRWISDRNRALWSSFVVRLPGGNVFFAGDTGAGDLRWADEAASYGPVRLALIPIGAFRFFEGQMSSASHIGPVDAVEVVRRLGASRSIGIHWGTFRLSSEGYFTPPRLLAAAMACTGQRGRFDTVRLGEPTRIASYASPAGTPAMPRAALLRCLDTPQARVMR
ncbi:MULTISPECIES: MBL fold metallo-hydrolase [unclassified Sphingomonas]|uniref:MBL fold metallo-hydrolase n=1 Tax=unclassified Sphingomonas TaxID=196159 RepID=UPI002685607A